MKKFVNKFLAVAVSFVTAIAMVPLGSGGVAYAETSKVTDNVKYFSTTMYNFDETPFNGATDTATGKTKSANNFYFISSNSAPWSMSKGTGYVNYGDPGDKRWENNKQRDAYNVLVQGIVKNTLDSDGNIQFNYKNAGVFADPEISVGNRKVYQNVQFPFVYDPSDGYYTFDSASNHVHVDTNKTKSQTLSLHSGKQEIGGNSSFFPFNQDGDTDKDYHFGMNMSVPFYMTEAGTDEKGNDMIFDFSGDDDVWVFVNGKLVLDLGGIHDAIGGSINFKTGAVQYKYTKDSSVTVKARQGNTATKSDVANNKNLYNDFNITRQELANQENNLQIFYLERGAGDSNCKIRFNLQQKDTLEVAKTLGENTPYTDSKFEFKIYYKAKDSDTYEPCSGKQYTLYKGSSADAGRTTGEDGTFYMQAGQHVNFTDNKVGTYKVVETTTGYTTNWTCTREEQPTGNKLTNENGYSLDVVENDDSQTSGTNKYKVATKYTLNCTNSAGATLNDDTIVLDYAQPVTYNVRTNDNSSTKGSANGVVEGIGISTLAKDTSAKPSGYVLGQDVGLSNGKIKLLENGDATYTPTKFMNSVDKATYVVSYQAGSGKDKTTRYVYGNVNVLPATSVYYEDDFGKSDETDSTVSIVWSEKGWTTTGTSDTDRTQSSDNSNYGWEKQYEKDTTYSGGSTHVTTDKGATATFTFKGTGVDVYSRTDGAVGYISAKLYRGVGAKTEDGKKKPVVLGQYIDNISESGTYYQVPTLSFEDLTYDTYTVVITAGMTGSSGSGTYYLDGIRVYNPLKGDSTAEAAYKKANEANAQYIELRDTLLEAGFSKSDKKLDGTVFIDKIDSNKGVQVGDAEVFKKLGPKNEVYLNPGQAVAFKIENYNDNMKVYAGLKALTGKATEATVTFGDSATEQKPIKSSNDLYYQITPTGEGEVLIQNTGKELLAITKIKTTNNGYTSRAVKLVATPELLSYAETFNNLPQKEETSTDSSDSSENLDKDDVEINNPSDDENKKDNNQTDQSNSQNNSFWNSLKKALNKWFGRR